MGKKKRRLGKSRRSRKHRKRNPKENHPVVGVSWEEEGGLHAVLAGGSAIEVFLAAFNKKFQEELRHSPLWDEMVEKFGEEEALNLLKECRMELRCIEES